MVHTHTHSHSNVSRRREEAQPFKWVREERGSTTILNFGILNLRILNLCDQPRDVGKIVIPMIWYTPLHEE
eukprot:6179027-Pleurochrysis_carterae.AAC.1